jgi:hypothetical protein
MISDILTAPALKGSEKCFLGGRYQVLGVKYQVLGVRYRFHVLGNR